MPTLTMPIVFLVHGVGDASPGESRRSSYANILDFGVEDDDLVGFDWNTVVDYPIEPGTNVIPLEYVSRLARSLLSCASIDFYDNAAESRFGHRLQQSTGFALQLLILGFPIIWLWCIYMLLCRLVWLGDTPQSSHALLEVSTIAGYITNAILSADVAAGHPAIFFTVPKIYCFLFVGLVLVDSMCGRLVHHAAIAVILRRLMVLLVWPLSAATAFPFSFDWLSVLYRVLPTMVYTLPLAFWWSLSNLQLPQYSIEYVGIAAISAVLIAILHKVVGPTLKILDDIACYIGDPKYRENIQKALFDTVRDKCLENRDVVFVGHSLGSVICAQFLSSNTEAFKSCQSVCLLTMGSPLHRYFYRFFPTSCPLPEQLAIMLAHSIPRFKWVNIFRPFDPIGGELSSGNKNIINRSTHQWRKMLFGAHTEYWSDPAVASAVASAFRDSVTSANAASSSYYSINWFNNSSGTPLGKGLAYVYSWIVALLIPIIVFFNVDFAMDAPNLGALEQNHIVTEGVISWKPEPTNPLEVGNRDPRMVPYATFTAVYPDSTTRTFVKRIRQDVPMPDFPWTRETVEVWYALGPPLRVLIPKYWRGEAEEQALAHASPGVGLFLGCFVGLLFFWIVGRPLRKIALTVCGY